MKPEPSNFLEAHALDMLTREPTWTLPMYAALNDLSEEAEQRLAIFLAHYLPAAQLRAR